MFLVNETDVSKKEIVNKDKDESKLDVPTSEQHDQSSVDDSILRLAPPETEPDYLFLHVPTNASLTWIARKKLFLVRTVPWASRTCFRISRQFKMDPVFGLVKMFCQRKLKCKRNRVRKRKSGSILWVLVAKHYL